MSARSWLALKARGAAARLRGGAAEPDAGAEPSEHRLPCAGLWNTPMVQVNGDLTTCCLDEHLENRLGNIRETPLAALWSGTRVHAWRVAHAEGRFADSGPLCTRCNWRSAGVMEAKDVEAYLELTHEAAALTRFRRACRPTRRN